MLDQIPPGTECPLSEPFPHLKTGLEFSHRPVVGEAGKASVLQEQGLLLGGWPECHPVGLQHETMLRPRSGWSQPRNVIKIVAEPAISDTNKNQ